MASGGKLQLPVEKSVNFRSKKAPTSGRKKRQLPVEPISKASG
jgi:hypothetical protein